MHPLAIPGSAEQKNAKLNYLAKQILNNRVRNETKRSPQNKNIAACRREGGRDMSPL